MAAFDGEQEAEMTDAMNGVGDEPEMKSEKEQKRKEKRKRKQMEEAKKLKNRGVCYISRVPPKMDPFKMRQLLSQYGEIERLYLAPENPAARMHRKKAGGFRGQGFSEGWVEFTDKRVAKRVAEMLNGQQIGGKKRSQFYYDIWNIKYMSKFKWDDLTEENTYKRAVREQKLVMEMSAAKKERDFYLSKVEKSHALSAIDERMKKKQKVQKGSDSDAERPADQQEGPSKVVRLFPQTKPVKDAAEQSKLRFNKALMAEVFNA